MNEPSLLIRIMTIGLMALIPAATKAQAPAVSFIPDNAALGYAARAYEEIWQAHGEALITALEAHTCLAFPEDSVSAIVADSTSHSGGPDHPMQLRASYPTALKQSTLAHELGHRHLWQLEERLDDIDGHMTLYLVLDLVWAEVWGQPFADSQILAESGWRSGYDYAEAWDWARSLDTSQRLELWQELLWLNGIDENCKPTRR